MTIDYAIERNQTTRDKLREEGYPTRVAAIQLGIEALKRMKALRRPEPPFKTADELLPGETSKEEA